MSEPQQPSIMVVDDRPENLDFLIEVLSAEHYEVRPLPNGELALVAAFSEPPDLILLDIMMPGLDGYEVCARLKADSRTREVPVIFLSALREAQDKVRAFAAGGVDYMSKPFQIEEVLARVRTHLRLSALQQQLSQHNQQLQEVATLFEISNDGITLTDADGVIQRVNPAFTTITGYRPEEVMGHTPRVLKSGHHSAEFYVQLWHELLTCGYWEGEVWNRHKQGRIYPHWQRITTLYDEQGVITGYISQFSDIARRQLTEEEIRQRGNYDILTGLANRFLLSERLELALKQHQRQARKLGVLMIELDRFNQVNSALGLTAGDHLLQQVAHRLQGVIRDIDMVARLGGDEFVVMLVDQQDHTHAERQARQVLERLGQPFALPAGEVDIGASIGISLFPDDGSNVDLLLGNANLALHRSKAQGGHQFHFFTESMGAELRQRHYLETELKQALLYDGLTVHYQPIIDLSTGRVRGVESLLRWQHQTLGPVSPATFIPMAESLGLMDSMGLWVIKTVCQQLRQWQDEGQSLYASVNVSTCQIPQGLNPEWLRQVIEDSGLTPAHLVLEVTESVFADDIAAVAEWLRAIRSAGFRVYLDDFGTGYSSLAYLRTFPVDAVKIDLVFIRDMVEQARDQALVRAIIAMSDSLGLQVVAEGVENDAQLRLLRNFNCAYGQGYLFSKPVAASDMAPILEDAYPMAY
jgi:diguanylate cyclase (GGDEF)-like protein/PAS domain S-box-containing protein